VTCAALYASGVFTRFWFWTFTYAREYATSLPLSMAWQMLSSGGGNAIGSGIVIWILAAIGLSALLWDRTLRASRLLIAGLLLFSFLAVCPGFYFREHYFVLMLPAVAVLAGVGVTSAARRIVDSGRPVVWSVLPLVIFVAGCAWPVYAQRSILFPMTPREVSRELYASNPFPESIEIADYIKRHTTKNDRIAVLGSEPQIYFYSDRVSATGYIYTYGLMEKQPYALKMQQDMIHEIEKVRPKYIVLVQVLTSWLARPDSEGLIFSWSQKYCQERYDRVGVVEIFSPTWTDSTWGDEAGDYAPSASSFVLIFKRKP
jgi:hypothetical protein